MFGLGAMRRSGRVAGAATALIALCATSGARAEAVARFADADPARTPATRAEASAGHSPAPSAAAAPLSAADQLLARAERYARAGRAARALALCAEALRIAPARLDLHLMLGRMREAVGDDREAERVYTAAARLPAGAAIALRQRARVRQRLGRRHEAVLDLQRAAELASDPATLEQLAALYVAQQNWPAALATWRKLAQTSAPASAARAAVQVEALRLLSGPSDPVTAGDDHPDWVRRALAAISVGASVERP